MESSDLFYLAQVEDNIGRSENAIDFLNQLADKQPRFDLCQRQFLVLCYKKAVDPIRETLRLINLHHQNAVCSSYASLADILKEKINDSLKKLQEICNNGIELVDNKLLPPCDDQNEIAFYKKLRGDLFRYQVEFLSENDATDIKKKADESYSSAYEISMQSLEPTDAVRLGVILNYAVLKYECFNDMTGARDIVTKAVSDYEEKMGQVDPSKPLDEAGNIVNIMKLNLESWANRLCEEEENYEEEAN